MTRPKLPPDTEWISPGYMDQDSYDPGRVMVAPGAAPPVPLSSMPHATVAAAGDNLTGGMIALVPADPGSLAIDGGEPADVLHLTLLFLGEAADWDGPAREALTARVGDLFRGFGNIHANAFGVDYWNPTGDTPSWVLAVGDGPDEQGHLQEAHMVADMAAADHYDLIPEQHTPWVAHVCLAYTDDLSTMGAALDRVGPVTFDRVRVAFADQTTDVPLEES